MTYEKFEGINNHLEYYSADVPVLIQSPSIQRVTEGHMAWLWCTMSKARLEGTDVHWYRKLPGQDMEWVLTHRAGGSPEWGRGFTGRFLPYRDTSNSSFTLTVTDVVHSDSAVYYCRVWGDIDGNGTQLIVTKMSRAPSYLAWLIVAVVLGVLAVTGGIFLIGCRAFRNHPSHPPTATDHRSPEAVYENVSMASGVPVSSDAFLREVGLCGDRSGFRRSAGQIKQHLHGCATSHSAHLW
ncbi:uncharacterized protein [Hemitrygon akajei]|uniref:uncharacterized protein isoform X2 n=1 Tax=Hemitrygon akajei TaxID=2704970 RepID=UPI003BFA2BFE